MGRSVRIMTIRGIDIKLHPTFLLALAWVAYYWGAVAGAGLQGVFFGVFVLLAIFVCVLGHELAHGFLALRYGLTVHDITLLPIGGVARIEQVALTPRHEAMIALAGPILNLIVAAGLVPFVGLVLLSAQVGGVLDFLTLAQQTSVSGLVLQLWVANIMLAVFNLLPAFPMDGGRILRAFLTVVTNRVLATRLAVVLGQVLALALVGLGFYARDISLPLVAGFILIAAFIEARMIYVESALRALPVAQFAIWDLGGISPESPLSYAVCGGPRDVVVTERGMVVGMLWREDVLALINRGHAVRVGEVMDRHVATMDIDSSVYDVHRRMLATGRPAIPITERGIYRGIFTSDRLAHVHQHLRANGGTRARYRGFFAALGLLPR